MIILYIPFEKNAAGDLPDGANIWEINHKRVSSEEIKIIYYKEEFDEESIPQGTVVYILAHGANNDPTFVANANDSTVATLIDIDTLAIRFTHDFLVINHHISHTHLYFCGNLDKNATLATNFETMLLRPEFSSINYYEGSISPPDSNGKLWSTTAQGTFAAISKQLEKTSENESEETHHRCIKIEEMESNFQKSQAHKRQNYQSSGIIRRWQLLHELRMQDHSSTDVKAMDEATANGLTPANM
ncbi:RNA binding protein (contains ribosomal protein S1 domain) [Legionella lansingensis]|uniref:RNA binding protein (Contains ribosomal protein S1 domain) n=1 Tax=Legionella lansingensis TaxID=45067 RepID=A0A0W0VEW0_9GAMM|nr:hypothetical protein [Legionella lansingensis]KTD18603.1 RNA binding protein (contains ribosomal protein S1 domain) [Legionella lansingensis]SNV43413.1 RNA binding protein (contains ribosomal protein S1 domain) [Legionella lansingensis]